MELSDEEMIIVDRAVEETDRYGHTDIKCPKCGSELEIKFYGNSYIVRCKKVDCIELKFRGI